MQLCKPAAKKVLDGARAAVSEANPNELRRTSTQYTTVIEIEILGDNQKLVLGGVGPDCVVVTPAQATIVDMHGVWEIGTQPGRQLGRKVFVKEQFHCRRRPFS